MTTSGLVGTLAAIGVSWILFALGFYYALWVASAWAMFSYARHVMPIPLGILRGSPHVPPVSLIVPAHNEEATIIDTVESLLSLDYPAYEIIVVNDGSADATLSALIARFALQPIDRRAVATALAVASVRGTYVSTITGVPVVVVDTANGGKARALNAGIMAARYPLVCTIDADSLLAPDALLRMARVYMADPARIVAIGGSVRVGNGCTIRHGRVVTARLPRSLVPAAQAVEYIKTLAGSRVAWAAWNGVPVVSGAFGLFRRDILMAVGGYRTDMPGEDMALVFAIHEWCLREGKPYRIAHCPDALCWTQAPATLRSLGTQRRRWSRGSISTFWLYRHMFGRPGFGSVGAVLMPSMLVLDLLGPYIIFVGVLLGVYAVVALHAALLLAIVLGVLVSIEILLGWLALLLDDFVLSVYPTSDVIRQLAATIHMTIWYYALTTYWGIAGHIEWLRGHNSWGTIGRASWKA